jgi:deazaflavin-dependent oxidoreductase (nitroreductase family)
VLPPDSRDEQFCYLTTTGRVTGRAHEIEIWFARAEGGHTLHLLAGGGRASDWVRNLVADPIATVVVGGTTVAVHGRVITDEGEARAARDLVFAKYQPAYGSDLTEWRERALPVALDLVAGAEPA